MKIVDNEYIIGVDVDETLVAWNGTEYKPMVKNIESLIRHYKRGHLVFVWSQGGAKWAQKVVEELGIEQYVDYVLAKPRWVIDDIEPNGWLERYWYGEDKGTATEVRGNSHHVKKHPHIPGLTDSVTSFLHLASQKQGKRSTGTE